MFDNLTKFREVFHLYGANIYHPSFTQKLLVLVHRKVLNHTSMDHRQCDETATNWSPKTSTEIIMLPKYSLSEIFEASIYTSWGRKKMEQTLQWMMLNMENVTPGQHKKPIKIWQNLILSHLKIHLLIFSKSYIHFLVYNYRGEIGPETQSRTLTTLIFL